MPENNFTDLHSTKLWRSYNLQPVPKSASIFKMWFESIVLSILIFILVLGYAYMQMEGFNILTVSLTLAGTGGMLIGISFALSGFCYYFDFLDRKIAYRKYIGLLGYFFAMAYAFSLLLVDPTRYYYGFTSNLLSADFILGITALIILTIMAVISNTWAMKKLGITTWRQILRLGYFAYVCLIIRAIILDYGNWELWIKGFNFLLTVRMILTVFAIGVIWLRLSMIFFPRTKN
jgi:DMSO/TMAO reductase YedYZ heme-binding membrane subunit